MTQRIGPKMQAAAEYVRHHPGCTKHEVSVAIGPHGSNNFGNRAVLRAIKAGLIEDRGGEPMRYKLYVTEKFFDVI